MAQSVHVKKKSTASKTTDADYRGIHKERSNQTMNFTTMTNHLRFLCRNFLFPFDLRVV